MALESTISIERASAEQWDVIVIGAGPAGSMASIRLARADVKVLVADKAQHPRAKICGCCLNANAVSLLEEVDFGGKLKALNAVPIECLSLRSDHCSVDLALGGGVALSRTALDSELISHAISSGASFLSRTRVVVDGIAGDGSRAVALECDGVQLTAQAKCVIVADGLNGQSLSKLQLLPSKTQAQSRIGAGAHSITYPPGLFEPGVIYMTCGKGGYVGMVLLEDGTLDVAAAFDRDFVQLFKNVGEAANNLIALSNLASLNLDALAWQGTPPLTRRRSTFSAPRLFVIGDAASYAEPFTGEGMAWALQSATSLVPIVLKLLSTTASTANTANFDYTAWDRTHASLIAGKQYFSFSIARFLRSPFLVKSAIRVLNLAPGLAAPIIKVLSAGGSKQTLPSSTLEPTLLSSVDNKQKVSGFKG